MIRGGKKEAEAIVSELETPIEFIMNECSDEGLRCLARALDDVKDKTGSIGFLNSLRQRVQSVEDLE